MDSDEVEWRVDGWDSWDSWSFGDRQQSKQLPASAEKSWFGPESRMTARKQAKPNKQTSEEVFRGFEGKGVPTYLHVNSFSGRWVAMTASFIKLHAVGEEPQFGGEAPLKSRLAPFSLFSGRFGVDIGFLFFPFYIFLLWPRGS